MQADIDNKQLTILLLFSTDFLRTLSQPTSKSPQKLFPTSLLPENQCSILNYADGESGAYVGNFPPFRRFRHMSFYEYSRVIVFCEKKIRVPKIAPSVGYYKRNLFLF